MYKYLRYLMSIADLVGDVNDIYMGEWGPKTKRLSLEGLDVYGKPFRVILEVEVGNDGT